MSEEAFNPLQRSSNMREEIVVCSTTVPEELVEYLLKYLNFGIFIRSKFGQNKNVQITEIREDKILVAIEVG